MGGRNVIILGPFQLPAGVYADGKGGVGSGAGKGTQALGYGKWAFKSLDKLANSWINGLSRRPTQIL